MKNEQAHRIKIDRNRGWARLPKPLARVTFAAVTAWTVAKTVYRDFDMIWEGIQQQKVIDERQREAEMREQMFTMRLASALEDAIKALDDDAPIIEKYFVPVDPLPRTAGEEIIGAFKRAGLTLDQQTLIISRVATANPGIVLHRAIHSWTEQYGDDMHERISRIGGEPAALH